METPSSITLNKAVKIFEATEANLSKLERVWGQIYGIVPEGIVFGSNLQYEDLCRTYTNLLRHLPLIDGWKPSMEPIDLDSIAQSRLDAKEVWDIGATVSVEKWIEEPGLELRDYRFRFNLKRRQLIRDAVTKLFNEVTLVLKSLQASPESNDDFVKQLSDDEWEMLNEKVKEVDTLLGSSVPRPRRWNELKKHLSSGQFGDLKQIVNYDWPVVKDAIINSLYGEYDPIPTGIDDLGNVIDQKPSGTVVTKLNWSALTPDNFERLIYSLISSEEGYENAEWLMHTNAPDRGRDLSVTRVFKDGLSGVLRRRVVIQCKHYQSKSITPTDVAVLKEQIKLWEPPRIDIVIVATSGRFTADAVAAIERHNQMDSALSIEMWAESHLESLLVRRPALIAEFNLR
nr:restriction endonuclease [Cohnella hashimotonis]